MPQKWDNDRKDAIVCLLEENLTLHWLSMESEVFLESIDYMYPTTIMCEAYSTGLTLE